MPNIFTPYCKAYKVVVAILDLTQIMFADQSNSGLVFHPLDTAGEILQRYDNNPVQIALKDKALQGWCLPEIVPPINNKELSNPLNLDTKIDFCKLQGISGHFLGANSRSNNNYSAFCVLLSSSQLLRATKRYTVYCSFCSIGD